MKRLLLSVLVSVFILSSLTACTNNEVGTTVGAVGGGIAGSALTGGSTAGTIAGAVGGGLIGHAVTN